MTGRIYLQPHETPLARHAAVVLRLDHRDLVFEDTRYFGRFTLDLTPLLRLGPEPLSSRFTAALLAAGLNRSAQSIKVKLLDQSLVAGIGNIYASEVLFRARIHPEIKARSLTLPQVRALVAAIRSVLASAIRWGSTVPLDWAGTGPRDGLFYYGGTEHPGMNLTERLRVYGREAQPCPRCRTSIRRVILGHRSAFFCPRCQR
jgi:formamidopyrimidine-DNA glycosylase